MEERFTKKLSELRGAANAFMTAFAGEKCNAVMHVSAIAQILKDVDDLWRRYRGAKDMAEATRFHNRIRSKALFIRSHFADSKKAVPSKDAERYADAHGYLQKKISEFVECIPKDPSVMQGTLPIDCVSWEVTSAPAKQDPGIECRGEAATTKEDRPAPSEESIAKAVFSKKANELTQAVNAFVHASSSRKGSLDQVSSYIDDMRIYIKAMENIWNKYWTFLDQSVVSNEYDSLFKQMDSIRSYHAMSVMIAKNNGCAVEYNEGHEYISKKIAEFENALPKVCRTLQRKNDAYAITTRESVSLDGLPERRRRKTKPEDRAAKHRKRR